MLDRTIYKKIHFDDGAQGFLILLLFSQLFFTNGIYLFLGFVCLWVIFLNLQQPLKPSVFTIIFIYHLIQVMAGVWLSNFLGKDLNFRSEHTGTATIFAYIGLMIMFAPIIHYQNKIPNISLDTLKKHAGRLSVKRVFRAYVIGFFVMNLLGGVAFIIPGLSQVIISFVKIKWFLFILFGLQSLLLKKMQKEFAFFVILEFMLGFFSFFSDFKTVMFFGAFIAIVFLRKVLLKHMIVSVFSILLLFYLGVMWTSIKGEYRAFLNQGSKSQNVTVGKEDALSKLVELSGNREENKFDESAAEFFLRLQYTYHLAKTMDRVPSVMPHEYGANIASILSFVTTPRFLNPDKPNLEASVKASKYTGISYLGASSGVSFSLGYFADCYIDFGYFGMMIPLLILGFILGGSYFFFIKRSSRNFLFNYAVVGAMFMEFHAFEMDGTYLMGRLFATLLTFFMLKVFFFRWLYNYLSLVQPMTEMEERAESVKMVKVDSGN
jgi:hypothetical protein